MAEACDNVLKSEKPFFLYFCTDDPHRGHPFEPDPWDAPNSFGNKTEGYSGVDTVVYDPKDVLVPEFLLPNPTARFASRPSWRPSDISIGRSSTGCQGAELVF